MHLSRQLAYSSDFPSGPSHFVREIKIDSLVLVVGENRGESEARVSPERLTGLRETLGDLNEPRLCDMTTRKAPCCSCGSWPTKRTIKTVDWWIWWIEGKWSTSIRCSILEVQGEHPMLSPAARAIDIRPIKDLVDSGNLAGVKKGWRGREIAERHMHLSNVRAY